MKQLGRFSAVAVLSSIMVFLMTVACTGSTETPAPAAAPTSAPEAASPGETPTQESPAVVATPTLAPAGPAVEAATPSDTIVVAIQSVEESADPRFGTRPEWQNFKTQTHDMLVEVKPVEGTMRPGAALSWESSSDGMTWTFHLRDDMTFHDGHPVTAEDSQFGYEWQCLTPQGDACHPRYREIVESVEVVDEHTVAWHLHSAQPLFNLDISSLVEPIGVILPKHYVEENNIDPNDPVGLMHTNPLGSGPWKVVDFRLGERFEWEAWEQPHPYRPTPAFDRLLMIETPEMATRMAMARTGEADIFVLDTAAVPEVRPSGLELMFVPETNQAFIQFLGLWDPRTPEGHPLQDVLVRKAISKSINRDVLIETVMGGYASYPIGLGVWTATNANWNPAEELERARNDVLDYDPEEARQLLVEAGYPNGEGFPEVNWFHTIGGASPWLLDIGLASAQMVRETLNIPITDVAEDGTIQGARFNPTGLNDEAFAPALRTRRAACRPSPLPRWREGLDPIQEESLLGREVDGEVLWTSQLAAEWAALVEKTNVPSTETRLEVETEMKEWMDENYIWPPMVSGGSMWGYNPAKLAPWQGTPCRTEIGIVYETMQPAS